MAAKPPPLSESPRQKAGKTLFAWMGAALALVYLINPTAGLFELIPDTVPVIGNLDEVAATALLIASLAQLGITIPGLRAPKPSRRRHKDDDVIDV